MAKLIYATLASLDGYIEDARGQFDWAFPSEEVHGFFNGLMRPMGTQLYGRRMYETMAVWEAMPTEQEPAVVRDFATLWRAVDKVVFSSTLPAATTPRTTLQRSFDPALVSGLKAEASRDLGVGGANLAAHAFRAGLVDECHLVLAPVAVGGGKPALPADQRLDLELLGQRRFANGMVHLHYRVRNAARG